MRDPESYVTMQAHTDEVSFKPCDVLLIEKSTHPSNPVDALVAVTIAREGVAQLLDRIRLELTPADRYHHAAQVKIFGDFLRDPKNIGSTSLREWNRRRMRLEGFP